MKMKPALLLTILAVAMAAAPAAAQQSQRITAGKANEYGLVYSLPLTAVDITLRAQITETTPGEFANYARRYLAVTDAVTEPARTLDLTGADITIHGVPDPDNRWLAQFKNGSNPFITLTPEGIPLAINAEGTMPAAVTAATTLTLTGGLDDDALAEARRSATTQEMAQSSGTSKRADLASQRIFELREMRNDLLSGQAENMPADGEALRVALDAINRQEQALTSMFAGTTRTYETTMTGTFIPDSTSIDGGMRVIGRLSLTDGFVAPGDLSGSPVTVELQLVEEGILPVDERGQTKTFPRGGVAYRIPGRALVIVRYADREVARATVDIAQYGAVFGLDPKLFTDRREPSKAIFDPATGALLQLAPANSAQ